MNNINIIFFGSTTDSVIVAEKLSEFPIVAVVTQPPKPVGRKQILTPTPVSDWAGTRAIPVLSFASHPQKPWLYEDEEMVADTLAPFKADLLISASFGQKIPERTIHEARFGGINVHPSILPRWRGADPVPWAILTGDHQIGVTIVTLSETFDSGLIVAQKKIPVTDKDTSDLLRTKLFTIGADLLIDILASKGLPAGGQGLPFKGSPAGNDSTYARKFTREDGFEPWEVLNNPKEAARIYRKFRALTPWPGLWSTIKANGEKKRLKILEISLKNSQLSINTVQLEGKKPVSFEQFSLAYIPHPT